MFYIQIHLTKVHKYIKCVYEITKNMLEYKPFYLTNRLGVRLGNISFSGAQ